MIEFLKKLVLAIIQGIAEILPISSSGHLIIASSILNIDTNGLQFLIFLHLGSLIALMIYYWKDIKQIIVSLCKYLFKHDRNEETKYFCGLFLKLIIASIPAGLIGVFLGDIIDTYLSNLYSVFSFLIITGIFLFFSKNKNGEKTLKELTFKNVFCIGCYQAIGVLPGISRSGITILGAKNENLTNEDAAHFSFLMFLPVTAGSFIIELIKNRNELVTSYSDIKLLLSDLFVVAVAGIVTFLSVKYLFKIIKKGKLHYFAYYCLAIGIIGLLVLMIIKY